MEFSLLTCAFMASSFVHLPHRTIVSLRGPDTIALLERLVTNSTSDWAIGETRYGALLTPQGKVIADFLAMRSDEGVWLDVSKDHAADLAKRLKMFRLRSQVEIDVHDELFVFADLDAAQNHRSELPGAAHVYHDCRYEGGRLRVASTRSDWAVSSKSITEYHADRIGHVVPEQGTDFGAAAIFPADINMDVLDGVALNKGCFVGQEVVSRMHRRGKIRKRTLHVELPPEMTAQCGAEIKAPLPIGALTSVTEGSALAVVRVDRLTSAEQTGDTVTIDETPVTIKKPGWLVAELALMEET